MAYNDELCVSTSFGDLIAVPYYDLDEGDATGIQVYLANEEGERTCYVVTERDGKLIGIEHDAYDEPTGRYADLSQEE